MLFNYFSFYYNYTAPASLLHEFTSMMRAFKKKEADKQSKHWGKLQGAMKRKLKAQSIIAARKSINFESRPKLWKEISGNNSRSEMNLNELSDPLINTADIR